MNHSSIHSILGAFHLRDPWPGPNGGQAETSSQQLALLQRRQDRMQRLEHDFAEERRAREAVRSGMELEMMQQRWGGNHGIAGKRR